MRVICIDGKCEFPEYCLKEGAVYDVIQSPYFEDSFLVDGHTSVFTIKHHSRSYKKHRFAPLSNIDEVELIQQREDINVVSVWQY